MNTQSEQSRGIYLQLALGMALYGSATPISRIITQAFPIFLAPAFRMGIAALILVPFAWSQRDVLRDLSRRDWLVLGAITLTGMFGFSLLMLLGMNLVSGVVGSIIMSTTPAVTALGAFIFLGDQFGWRRITAVVLAVVGVLILQVSSAGGDNGSNVLLGSALVFGAVCCEASFTLLAKFTSKQLSPLLITTITSLMAAVLFVPLAAWDLRSFDFSQPQLGDWLALLWWGAGALALGTIIWYTGVKQVAGSIAAGFMGVMPVSALVLSYVLLGEAFQWIHIIGFAIVFGGVLLIANAHQREHQQQQEHEAEEPADQTA